MKCKDAIPRIHEYLDGDLQGTVLVELNEHVSACPDCSIHLMELEKADALIHYLPKTMVPEGLTERIMQVIPQKKKSWSWRQWVQRHPAVSVASVFIVVMMSSFLSLWYHDTELRVQGADLDQVIIKGNTVTVPAGQTFDGDLVVENGKVQVNGRVHGNITVIDGSVSLASTANISGKVTKINQALDWFWYKVHEMFAGLPVVRN